MGESPTLDEASRVPLTEHARSDINMDIRHSATSGVFKFGHY